MANYTCTHCGKNFSNNSGDYNYSRDRVCAFFRDSFGKFKRYHFCCDGHFQQYNNITDMIWVNESGFTGNEEYDIKREKEREQKRIEDARNTIMCEHCCSNHLYYKGVSAFFRTTDKSSYRKYDFCSKTCLDNFKKESHVTHVDSDGLTYDERANIKNVTEENEKEIKIFTNKVLNDLLKESTKRFSDIYQGHYNKVPNETNMEYIKKCSMSLVRKCQNEMHEKVKIEDSYNKKEYIINKRRIIFSIYNSSLNVYTWEKVVECLEVKEKEITGTVVEKKKQPEIIEELTKSVNEIKTEFKKAFTDIKTEFKNIFKK